jgi:peroxiredoxin
MSAVLRQGLAAALIAVLAGGGGFLLARHLQPSGSTEVVIPEGVPRVPSANGALEGQPAPDLALNDLDGRSRKLSEWRGRWLLVNFWATWCSPCMAEIPLLIAVQREHEARGLSVLGIAMDDPEAVRGAVQELGFNYPTLAGDEAVLGAMEQLGNTLGAIPYTVLIDPSGIIRYLEMGGIDAGKLDLLVQRFLPVAP